MPTEKNFGMRLSPHERRQIERLAAARETTMKEAVLEAVRHRLGEIAEPFRAEPGSVLDGLEDIIGSAEGPEDLSANRAYLEGYGR